MAVNKNFPKTAYQYICIEGNIGAGKTSLAGRIARDYNARLLLEEFEENSFLPKFYNDPDKYAFPLELSFMAERFQQMKDFFSTMDMFRPMVVSDYLFDKSLVFSRKTLPDDLFKLYSRLFRIMSSSLPRPDLIIYLYLNTENLQKNIKKRGRSYEQQISLDYLTRIQESYLKHIRSISDHRILLVDSNQLDFVTNENDYRFILALLGADYHAGVHTIIPGERPY